MRFAARAFVQAWWFELVLPRIGFGGLAARGRPARLRRLARRFHVLAVDLGGLMIKVGQFMSSRLDILPPEITDELEGLQDEVAAEPFAGIRAQTEAELGHAARARLRSRSTRCRSPRHPSVRRIARDSPRPRRRPGLRRCRGQGAAARHRPGDRGRPRGAAPGEPVGRAHPDHRAPGRRARPGRGVRRDQPRRDRLPARGRECRALRRRLRGATRRQRSDRRVGAHLAAGAHPVGCDGDQDHGCRGPRRRRHRPERGRHGSRAVGVPADLRRRLLPRRPAPRQHLRDPPRRR